MSLYTPLHPEAASVYTRVNSILHFQKCAPILHIDLQIGL